MNKEETLNEIKKCAMGLGERTRTAFFIEVTHEGKVKFCQSTDSIDCGIIKQIADRSFANSFKSLMEELFK